MVELTLITWLIYAGLGKVVIFLGMKFPRPVWGTNEFIDKLFSCDLCLGVWIYSILAVIFNIDAISEYVGYVPVLNPILTGMFTAFVVHLFSLGWSERFSIITLE